MVTKNTLLAYIAELDQRITDLDFTVQELDEKIAKLQKEKKQPGNTAKATAKRPVGRPRKER